MPTAHGQGNTPARWAIGYVVVVQIRAESKPALFSKSGAAPKRYEIILVSD
jgi:hypothetical protein